MKIGRKIYYDKVTGNKILELGESLGYVVETTMEQDFECFIELNQRDKSTVGLIQLQYGQLSDQFRSCKGYKVNIHQEVIDHNSIAFNYDEEQADPSEQEIFQAEQLLNQAQILANQSDLKEILAVVLLELAGGGDENV